MFIADCSIVIGKQLLHFLLVSVLRRNLEEIRHFYSVSLLGHNLAIKWNDQAASLEGKFSGKLEDFNADYACLKLSISRHVHTKTLSRV